MVCDPIVLHPELDVWYHKTNAISGLLLRTSKSYDMIAQQVRALIGITKTQHSKVPRCRDFGYWKHLSYLSQTLEVLLTTKSFLGIMSMGISKASVNKLEHGIVHFALFC